MPRKAKRSSWLRANSLRSLVPAVSAADHLEAFEKPIEMAVRDYRRAPSPAAQRSIATAVRELIRAEFRAIGYGIPPRYER